MTVRRLHRSWLRPALAAGVLALAGSTLAVPATAGVLTTDGDVSVVDHAVVLSWVDGQQRMVIDLDVLGQLEETGTATILLAVPTMPEVSVVDPDVLDEVAAAAAPAVIVEDRWWPDLESFGGSDSAVEQGPSTSIPLAQDGLHIHGQPTADQLLEWYAANGIRVGEAASESIRRYGSAGWTFVDFKLDAVGGRVDGRAPALELRFATDRPVVPLLMNASNSTSFDLATYVLARERMDRSDAMRGTANTTFSGPVTQAQYPGLTEWLAPFGGSAVLTRVEQTFTSPSRISDDVYFQPSTYGPVDAGTEVQRVDKILLGLPAGLVLVAGGMLLLSIIGVTISQLMRRRYDE